MNISSVLKPGWRYQTYNTGELPCAEYIQELVSPSGQLYKRSKGTLATDGRFSPECPVEYFQRVAPQAFFKEGEVTLIKEGRGSASYAQAGDAWVQILSGFQYRAVIH